MEFARGWVWWVEGGWIDDDFGLYWPPGRTSGYVVFAGYSCGVLGEWLCGDIVECLIDHTMDMKY